MKSTIAVLPGDGIGQEVIAAAVKVMRHGLRAAGVADADVQFVDGLIGGTAFDTVGDPMPQATIELCDRADAILLGAVGGPKWEGAPVRVEHGLLILRKRYDLFANLRPIRVTPAQAECSPLKREIVSGVDILFVRELTGGVYFGERQRNQNDAWDKCSYSVPEIERIVRRAAELARTRSRRLVSVDKANILATSQLWRATAQRVVDQEFPDVELQHQLVDSMAMHLLGKPREFDVVVTENMFGDILTDEASMLTGSLGMLPSASLGEGTKGLYEPVHGSAPDIAGKGIANPYAAILSGAMLLRLSLGLVEVADTIERACNAALEAGIVTKDLDRNRGVGTDAVTGAVIARI